MSEWRDDPHSGRRVRVAPGRDERPSDFHQDAAPKRCPFCAGSEADTPRESDRLEGADGRWLARSVANLYPAVEDDDGAHEVVIESPRHVTRFIDLTTEEAAAAVTMWSRRIAHWRRDPRFSYQLVFKNEGRAAGASLEHVHSQVVAMVDAPRAVADRPPQRSMDETRLVAEESGLVAYCPPAPRFALETWLEPTGDASDAASLAGEDAERVARLLQKLLRKIESLGAMAINLLVHAGVSQPWRIEIAPRTAVIAGFELATGLWINPVSPEIAAARLREPMRE